MYKRKVRVLFFDLEPGLNRVAASYGNALGKDWLEARATSKTPNPIEGRQLTTAMAAEGFTALSPSETLDDELFAWADLVMTLGDSKNALPPLPAHAQTRHWPVSLSDGLETALAETRRRVEGVIGGLRMMARSDSPI